MAKAYGCPFCRLDTRVLRRNRSAQAFLSNPRKTKGHLIVTPKRHIERPWELKQGELKDIFELIFDLENKMIGKFGDGCDIRQNYRPFLKQSRYKIDHIHFHVIPRKFEDRIYDISEKHDYELFEDLPDSEEAEVSKFFS